MKGYKFLVENEFLLKVPPCYYCKHRGEICEGCFGPEKVDYKKFEPLTDKHNEVLEWEIQHQERMIERK